jgi:hypothetical protein
MVVLDPAIVRKCIVERAEMHGKAPVHDGATE